MSRLKPKILLELLAYSKQKVGKTVKSYRLLSILKHYFTSTVSYLFPIVRLKL